MSLDILKKDVIDDTVVNNIIDSPVNTSHDKSVVDLFGLPLSNYIPNQSNSSEVNFHGINVSVEKYITMSENLTNFIVENRQVEKESNIDSLTPGNIKNNNILNEENRDISINKNLKMDASILKNNNDNLQIIEEKSETQDSILNLVLEENDSVACISENSQEYLNSIEKELEKNFVQNVFSPNKNLSSTMILASTPRVLQHAPRIKRTDSLASYFEESGVTLSPPNKNLAADKNQFILDECCEEEMSFLNNQSPENPNINHIDNKCLPIEPKDENKLDYNVPSDSESEACEIRTYCKFTSPNVTPIKQNFSPQSKRELFLIPDTKKNLFESNLDLSKSWPKRLPTIDNKCENRLEASKNKGNESFRFEDMDKKIYSLHESNMSVEEVSLANSFLNMSVDDNEIKKSEFCRSAKKSNLCRIEETKGIEQADIITEEVKSYKLPFVSLNAEENKDNNNNEWDYLKSLDTDEDRYRVVRSVWKNMQIPDPNVNLSCFHFYHKYKSAVSHSNDTIFNRKRQREESDDQGPTAKRCKFFNNINFFYKTLVETKKKVIMNFRRDHYLLRKDWRNVDKLTGRFHEKMNQLEGAGLEVKAIHSFYKGLPNQTTHDQQNVEREQCNVNKLYEQFRQIYKWSGRAFTHIINI